MPAKHYEFRIREAFFEGICVLQISGRMMHAAGASVFRKLLEQKFSEGVRFFVMDFDGFALTDSSGVGELVRALTTINMRSGKLVLVNCQRLMGFLEASKLVTTFTIADDFRKAFSLFGVKVTKGKTSVNERQVNIEYEEKYSVGFEEIDGKQVWFKNDNLSETPQHPEYAVQEIPPKEPKEIPAKESKEFTPKMLSYVVLSFVVALALIISGLVWAVKAVSSIPLLTLVFSVALLFFLILIILVLLLSGRLSEKAASKLLGGVLGKVPGLGVRTSKASTKEKN